MRIGIRKRKKYKKYGHVGEKLSENSFAKQFARWTLHGRATEIFLSPAHIKNKSLYGSACASKDLQLLANIIHEKEHVAPHVGKKILGFAIEGCVIFPVF